MKRKTNPEEITAETLLQCWHIMPVVLDEDEGEETWWILGPSNKANQEASTSGPFTTKEEAAHENQWRSIEPAEIPTRTLARSCLFSKTSAFLAGCPPNRTVHRKLVWSEAEVAHDVRHAKEKASRLGLPPVRSVWIKRVQHFWK